MNMNVKIGEYIAEKRRQNNMTQDELAKMLHVSNKTISKWETGNSVFDVIRVQEIARILNTDAINILNGEDVIQIQKKTYAFEKQQYQTKIKRKMYFYIFLTIAISSIILLLMYINRVKTYEMESNTETAEVKANIIDTLKYDILTITNITYNETNIGTEEEVYSQEIKIEIIDNNGKVLESSNIQADEVLPLNDLLQKYNIYIKEDEIEYKTITVSITANNNHKIEIPLKLK